MNRRTFLTAGGQRAPRRHADAAGGVPPQSGGDRPIRIGFIGVGGRGSFHLDAALGIEGVEVPCLCDVNNAYLYRAKRWVEASGRATPRLYNRSLTDFERLCDDEELDAVLCATSWEWHVPIALAAMRTGKHAIVEVPIVLTVDEGWEIIETFERTGRWATLGVEGFRSLTLTHMVHEGLFGEIRHAEGGYVHDLRLVKFDPEREPWRLHHAVTRNGSQYPDHPMSAMMPQLDINHGDRFEYLVSMSSRAVTLNDFARFFYGEAHPYATQPMAQGDCNVTLIRSIEGKMVTLNFDTNTPHPRGFYRLQGTKGVWWSPHYVETPESHVYIEGRSPERHQWEPAVKYLEEYEHPVLKAYQPPPRAQALRGHGGAARRTPIEWHRMIAALREDRMPDWDVYDSVTSSVIAPLSEQSVAAGGRPVDFPDFTRGAWKTAPRWTLT